MRYLMVSLLIHGFIFAFSGLTFIPHAQYSVQPSVQTVEVSLRETGETSDEVTFSSGVLARSEATKQSFKKIASSPLAPHNEAGVRIKANPNYFQNPSPEYPELARQMRQEGLVILSVDVDRTGEPIKVEMIQSSGYRLLDQAALKAVSHWKFQPGSMGNIPIESTVTVPIRFRLEK
jgi:protein TonB